ncbi:MAG TPA: hypothetical protein VI318_17635 [Baekduia sp.]
MSEDDRSADHTEDPRKQEEGSGGYPESTPSGTEGADPRKRKDGEGSPATSSGGEADREKTTGNPNAAG